MACRIPHGRSCGSSSTAPPASDLVIGAGENVGTFTATTVAGVSLTNTDLVEGTLVGFFAPGCSACETQLPRFVEVAGAHPGGAERVLAAVIGEGDAQQYVDALNPVATVVTAPHDHDLATAFRVQGYPSFARIGEQQVVEVGGSLAAVAPIGVPS